MLHTEKRDVRKKGTPEVLQCHGALRRQRTQSASKVASSLQLQEAKPHLHSGNFPTLTFYAYGSRAS